MSLYQISDIVKINPDWYDPNHSLSQDDQKFIWENMPLSEEDETKLRQTTVTEQGVSLSGSVNGGCKLITNADKKLSKGGAILELRECNYKTAPKIIAKYLEIIFSKYPSKEGHWLFISQHYTPKTINNLINQILKQAERGEITLRNPSSYFTDTILRFRKMRKIFRGKKFRIKPREELE